MISNELNFCDLHELTKCSWQFVTKLEVGHKTCEYTRNLQRMFWWNDFKRTQLLRSERTYKMFVTVRDELETVLRTHTYFATKVLVKWLQTNWTFVICTNVENVRDSSWRITKLCIKLRNAHELCYNSIGGMISNELNFCDLHEVTKCSWQFVTN